MPAPTGQLLPARPCAPATLMRTWCPGPELKHLANYTVACSSGRRDRPRRGSARLRLRLACARDATKPGLCFVKEKAASSLSSRRIMSLKDPSFLTPRLSCPCGDGDCD